MTATIASARVRDELRHAASGQPGWVLDAGEPPGSDLDPGRLAALPDPELLAFAFTRVPARRGARALLSFHAAHPSSGEPQRIRLGIAGDGRLCAPFETLTADGAATEDVFHVSGYEIDRTLTVLARYAASYPPLNGIDRRRLCELIADAAQR